MSITTTGNALLPIRRDGQISGGSSTLGGGGSSSMGGGGGITAHSALSQLDYASSGHTGFAPSDNPTFTTGITTPILKVTTGAAAGNMLISDADGDLSYLAAGATTKILVGGGAANPVWTEATGTGAPVRAGDPTFTGTVNTTTIHGTTLLIDHIGEHTGGHTIVFDNAIKGESLESVTAFSSGFTGNGYKVIETGGQSAFECDSLRVRGTLYAYELEINKITSVNGGLAISAANGTTYKKIGTNYYFDTNNLANPIQFKVGDFIRAQNWTGVSGEVIVAYSGVITAVVQGDGTLGTAYITATTASGTSWDKMDLVQWGGSDTARQSIIYITAHDANNPYIAGYAGVGSDGDTTGHLKFQLGNLAGITDATLSPSGYGLYAQNVFLSGKIVASTGTIGGWTIGSTTLTGGNAVLSNTGVLTLGTGNDVVVMSAADATYRLWAGYSTPSSAPFSVTKAGQLRVATIGDTIGNEALYFDSPGSTIYTGASGWNLNVKGTLTAQGLLTAVGVHIGGTTTPGTDNLLVDGTTTLTGTLDVNGAIDASGSTNINLSQKHTQAVGTNDITCSASLTNMSGMSVSITPKGTKILCIFSAPFYTATAQSFYLYMNVDSAASIRIAREYLAGSISYVSFQYIADVTPNVNINILVQWIGTTGILQRGSTDSDRCLTVIDLM